MSKFIKQYLDKQQKSKKRQVDAEKQVEKLDIRAEVDQLKSQMNRVWQALNIKN